MADVTVIEVYGQFAAQVGGKVKLFPTKGEAESAAVMEAQGTAFEEKALAYCESRGLDPKAKMAKGKMNVIVDFLAFEAAEGEVKATDSATDEPVGEGANEETVPGTPADPEF